MVKKYKLLKPELYPSDFVGTRRVFKENEMVSDTLTVAHWVKQNTQHWELLKQPDQKYVRKNKPLSFRVSHETHDKYKKLNAEDKNRVIKALNEKLEQELKWLKISKNVTVI